VENNAGDLVTALAAVELVEDTAAVGFVVDVGQQVERLDDAAELFQRPRSRVGRSFVCSVRINPPTCTRPSLSEPAKRSRSSQCSATILVFTLCEASLSRAP